MKFFTQRIDTYIDNFAHPPLEYRDEASARRYASDRTKTRECEIRVLGPEGQLLDTYYSGEPKGSNIIDVTPERRQIQAHG